MKTSDELELEYELFRRNNPDKSEVECRKHIYRIGMLSVLDEMQDNADPDARYAAGQLRRHVR